MVNGWAIASEIDARWQSAEEFGGRSVEEIAMIGKVRNPAVEEFPPPRNTRPLR